MREMKDSGVAWIGKIPHCWNTSKLKYLGQYINGYAFKPEEWGSKGVPIIRIQDLTGSNDNPNYFEGQIDKKYWVENGDILISWAATLDAFVWNKGNGWLNQHIFKAVPNRRIINYDFFFWMIKESMKNMNNDNKHGIFMQHVTLSVFNNFTIPMPPLAEQERIAAFLDAQCAEIDAVLEKTRASIEEYKKLKQAVITQAVTKGIRGDRPMKDSGIEWIGDIPAEWSVVPFSKFARVSANLVNPSDYQDYLQVSPENIEKDSGKLLPCKTVSEVGVESWNHFFHKGQILYSKIRPKLNKVCIAPFDGLCSADMYPIDTDNISKFVVYTILSNDFNQQVAMITENRVKMPKINQKELSKIIVVLPADRMEQQEIVDYLDGECGKIDALIAKKQQYLTEIENYKKSLIYEYVTGKKEVKTSVLAD